jgi:hypothetical protein
MGDESHPPTGMASMETPYPPDTAPPVPNRPRPEGTGPKEDRKGQAGRTLTDRKGQAGRILTN